MNNLPKLAILIVTYDRPSEIRATIRALRDNVIYPPELIHWHICDDDSPSGYVYDIQREFPDLHITVTVTQRKGWGANVNKGMGYALSHLKCDYVFLCEDDYVAMKPINLRDGVLLMEEVRGIGLVRFDGISAHDMLILYLKEVKLPSGRAMDYMIVDRASPHLNVYSHRPHIKHRRFHSRYGPYKEGTALGHTETEFAHRVKDNGIDGPLIAILHDGVERAFDHIGCSRQGTVDDIKFKRNG